MERRIFQNDTRIEKQLYGSLNHLWVKVDQKWMYRLLPRLLLLLLLLQLLLPIS